MAKRIISICSLTEFKNSLHSNDKSEDYWRDFFTDNHWIFGYGLNYKFLVIESDQPNYGGENYKGKGKQKGDYLTFSESNSIKFTVLVARWSFTAPNKL